MYKVIPQSKEKDRPALLADRSSLCVMSRLGWLVSGEPFDQGGLTADPRELCDE